MLKGYVGKCKMCDNGLIVFETKEIFNITSKGTKIGFRNSDIPLVSRLDVKCNCGHVQGFLIRDYFL